MSVTLDVRIEEQQLDAAALKLFAEHASHFTPTHPWVFVRVLPREQLYNGLIIVPDGKQQNKPVHEGIVLATWKPFTQRWRQQHEGTWVDCEKDIHSECEIGDHVLYPHHAGMDACGWDERYYRLVPEHTRTHRGIDSNGIIFAKLNYPRESVQERMGAMLDKHLHIDDPTDYGNVIAKELLKEFDVISKQGYSKTLSGK